MILDLFQLTDRVAIVTAAGRGIGAAIAKAFAEVGADVVIGARTESQLGEVAGHHRGAAAERSHVGGNLVELRFGSRADHDVGADFGEGLRNRGADAAAGPGHDGDPVGELEAVENHGTFSSRANQGSRR